MDYVLNWTSERLSSNDSVNGTFAPPLNAQYLAGDDNTYGQYSEKLFGNAPGDFDHSSGGDEEAADAERLSKNSAFIIEEKKRLAPRLKALAKEAKENKGTVPTDQLRNRSLISRNVADYEDAVDILYYFPARLALKCDSTHKSTCWNGAIACWTKSPSNTTKVSLLQLRLGI
jgi:hypothetical protein